MRSRGSREAEEAEKTRVRFVAAVIVASKARLEPFSASSASLLPLLFTALVLSIAPAPAAAKGLPEPVRAALARAKVPEDAVAVVVEPVLTGPVLVSHEARTPMHPASVMKLFTTFAALELLGPAFTFRTDVLATGTLAGGVLAGDLVLRGGGDPKLTYERLWQIAHHLRARGVREIRGDVILDRGYFAPAAPHDPGGFDKEPRRAYNVGADALLVNFQAVDFRFIPETGAVRVTGEPDLPNVDISSRIRPVPGPCGSWRHGLAYDVVENGLLATVTFSGTYPSECGERTWPLALLDATRFTEAAWRWVWAEAGGALRGKVRVAPTPPEAWLVHRHESEPLANLVRDTNKFSNNVMARHIFLALSAEPAGAGGEAQASARVVAEWLRRRGIDAPELVLENGSGLSRNERASAATIAALLRLAWASPVMPELAASLPVLSVDGTLKQRGRLAGGQAHLKGGTLTGVQAVAGYVLDRRGRRWIVVMVINHANAGPAQLAMDALVDWVYRSP
jgi:D-alanyl-D-alanine carboxypeptidase/D-alanyl-D-alanine-endopeptidase (penicillin-binding protein 4)